MHKVILRKCAKKLENLSNIRKTLHTTTNNTNNTVSEYPVPALTPTIIKEKLNKANITFVDSHTCYRLPECTMCFPLKKPTAGRSAETYVNKQTGYFVCELCKNAGSWHILERLIAENKKEVERTSKEVAAVRDGLTSYCEKGQQSWKKIAEECVLLHELPDEEYTSFFNDICLPEIPKKVSEKLSVRLSNDRKTIYMPLTSFSSTVLGHVSYNLEKGFLTTPRKDCAGFLHLAPKRKISSAVLVSNISDFFALASANLTINIICLPYGVANLPQISLPFLDQFESLVLWFGAVQGAWDATRNFAKKLNDKRCFLIRSTEKQTSPTIAMSNGEDVRKIISGAQPTWHQAITTFASLRSDVLLELQNHEQVLGVKWNRFPALNKTLKGLRRGELTVLTGPTGAGKTTFMAEYSLDLATQGVNTLWGSFEVRNVRLARTMLQQFVGKPLEDNISEFDTWANHFERLPLYYLTFHGQQGIKNVMDAVQHAAYVHDIAHVIIDNVQFMIGMTEDNKYFDRFHKQDLIIHAFRTFATQSNVHVTLVIHPRKERETDDLTASSIFGGAKAAQEADNVLIIQDKRLTNLKGKKYLQVAKNRYTGDLGIMLLEFDKDSLSFSPKKKKVSDEKDKSRKSLSQTN